MLVRLGAVEALWSLLLDVRPEDNSLQKVIAAHERPISAICWCPEEGRHCWLRLSPEFVIPIGSNMFNIPNTPSQTSSLFIKWCNSSDLWNLCTAFGEKKHSQLYANQLFFRALKQAVHHDIVCWNRCHDQGGKAQKYFAFQVFCQDVNQR